MMSDQENTQKNNQESTCDCGDSNCCQPKPRNRWQKIAFFVVVILAAGLIGYKMLYKPAPACEGKGCCGGDTTECVKSK